MARRWYVVGIALLAATIALIVDVSGGDDEGRPSADPRDPVTATSRTGTALVAGSRGVHVLPPIGSGELRLEGLVVDEVKHPVAGAKVTLGGTRTVTTEDDGSFAFDHLAEAEYDLSAEAAEGYAEEHESQLSDTSDPVMLELRHSTSVSVRVVAAESGQPIPDAKVSTSDRVAYTGSDGVAVLRSIATGMTRIEAIAGGRALAKLYVSTDDPALTLERTIELSAGSDVSGVVVDAAGKPVGGATVSIATEAGNHDWETADDSGRFTFHAIAAGGQVMSAYAERHIATDDITVETDGVHPKRDVVVKVEVGGSVTGIVVDRAGAPVANAVVRGYGRASSDEAGRFTLDGIPPGSYEVSATTEHAASPELKFDLARGETKQIRIVVGEGSLAGRVVDSHGAGTGDVAIRATHVASGRKWRTHTDDDGAFDFGGVEPGDYKLTVERSSVNYPEDPPATLAHAGDRKLRLVVADVSTITGRVVMGGRPVGSYGISISAEDSFSSDVTPVRTPSGRFERADCAPGLWKVTIVGSEFGKKIVSGVRLREGQTTELGDIAVEPARVVTGRVVDQSGRPIAGARVEVTDGRPDHDDDTMSRLINNAAVVRTDASGAFRIASLANGTDELQISATHPSGGATLQRKLGPTDTDVRLVLEATGSIDGKVTNYDDRQLGAIAIRVGSDVEVIVDLDKAGFHFTGLPAGDYDVRIRGQNTLSAVRVTVVAGQHARADFALPRLPITLRLDHPECSGMTLRDLTGHELAFESCTDGRSEITNVSPGRYQICVDSADCQAIEVVAGISVQIFDVP